MADTIKIRAGNKATMPKLAVREVVYCKDENAIYVGTEEGNKKAGGDGVTEQDKQDIIDGVLDGLKGGEGTYEDGVKSEYNRFWDIFQQNGERTNYLMGLAGVGWTDETFKPKYPIVIAENYDGYVFRQSQITRIPRIELLARTKVNQLFYEAVYAQTIDCVYFQSEVTTFNSTFQSCRNLANLTIDGAVERPIAGSLNLQHSPLSVASMKNIIEHLKDFTGTGAEYTATLTLSEDCWTALESDSTAPNGGTWKEYVRDVLCWNV